MNARALLAWNLRRLRSERGLSQERLAADADVDRAYLSELERAQNSASLDLLDRLASALAVPVAALLATPDPDDEPPANLPRGRKPK